MLTSAPQTEWRLKPASVICQATASVLFVFIVVCLSGCGLLESEQHESTDTDRVTRQSGSLRVPEGKELDVYYPIPYALRPNVQISSVFNHSLVIEQQPDHFRVKNPSPFAEDINWEARGVTIPASASTGTDSIKVSAQTTGKSATVGIRTGNLKDGE
jgi:hypothetical protein